MAEYRNRPLYRPEPLTNDEREAIKAIIGGITDARCAQEPAPAGEDDAAVCDVTAEPASA